MAFSQASIVGDPVVRQVGAELSVSWTSTAAAGTLFQLYLNQRLTWWGTARSVRLPLPREAAWIDVGTVGPTEGAVDFSASLTAPPLDRVRLDWAGGTWESPTLAGFHVYQSPTPGAAISYAAPVGDVPYSAGDHPYGGYGFGGYGQGGYGTVNFAYSWTSARLSAGVWQFAVAPYDAAGNEAGTPATATVTLALPPRPPLAFADGLRLHYTLDGTGHPVLTWNASPGA